MVVLSAGYWVTTFVAILSSIYTILMCWYILNRYTLQQKAWKKLEYQMILLRVFFDALTSVLSLIYFLISTYTFRNPDSLSFDVPFLIGIASSSFVEMRSYLAVVIAIERAFATVFPVQFFRYRKSVSNIPIVGFVISTGIALVVVMFWVCELKLPLADGCTNFNCAAPRCYQVYHAVSVSIYSSLNALFSLILCLKLLMLSFKHVNLNADFRKPNLLSLTDGLSSLIFEMVPAVLFAKGIIDFTGIGPIFGALRLTGRGVETTVMAKLMQ